MSERNLRSSACLGFTALLLASLAACKRPESAPLQPRAEWEQAATQASDMGARSLQETRQVDYREGFRNGAAMVRAALEVGQRPYLLRLGTGPANVRPLGALPPGFEIEEAPLASELDPETGLEIRFVQGDLSMAFTRGQIEGFAWALERDRARLIKPRPRPALPRNWETWKENAPSQRLSAEGGTALLQRIPGGLLWQTQRLGFPILRRWRMWSDQNVIRAAALGPDCLWVETVRGELAAVDLETGVIREVLPASARNTLPTGQELRQQAKREEAEQHSYRQDLLKRAEAGDGKAMLALAHNYRASLLPRDADLALLWYQKAAEAGEPEAMLQVAMRLLEEGSPLRDLKAARALIEKAAKAGNAEAQTYLELLARSEGPETTPPKYP